MSQHKPRILARSKWWALAARRPEPKAAATATDLLIYGDIGESWADDSIEAADLVKALADLGPVPLNVRINSYGGSVSDGIAIYNALKAHPAPVMVTVDGVAVSCASLIAMAGSSVRCYANSLLMIHAPWGVVAGNAAEMTRAAEMLGTYAKAMATSYAAKTGKPVADMLAILEDGLDHWYGAEDALAAGFCDLIVDPAADGNPVVDPAEEDDAEEAAPGGMPAEQDLSALFTQRPFDLSRYPAPAAVAASLKEISMKIQNRRQYNAPAGGEGAAAGSAAAAATTTVAAPSAAEVRAALKARNEEIGTVFAAFRSRAGVAELERDVLADPEISVQAAQQKLLTKLGDGAQASGQHVVLAGLDAREKMSTGAMAALMDRAGIRDRDEAGKPVAINMQGNEFRGLSLTEIARACLRNAGANAAGLGKMDVVGQAFTYTGSDFPMLLQNLMNKALLKGYSEADETFPIWTTIGNLPDFKQASRVDITQFPALDNVPDGGEYKTAQGVGDRGQYIQLATYGKIFSVTRQTVINDDLQAMTRVPQYMGRAAIRTVGNLVYAVLTGNPALRDTVALFHATHGNILTGAAISSTSVDAARVAMATQKENGAILDIGLSKLIVPKALGGLARQVRDGQYQVDAITSAKGSQNTIPNQVRGIFDVVEDARLDAASSATWYAVADKNITDTIEVAYLDGNPLPFLDQQMGWTIDGTSFKVRLDAGVSPLDYRTMFRNAGP